MTIYEIEIPTRRPIELLLIGDIHAGHQACDYAALDRVRKYLSRSKYRIWGGMGDYIETVTSINAPPGAIWTQEVDPGEQVDWFNEYWQDVPPQWLIRGNHEDRVYKATGIQPTKWMAKELDCLYANIGGYITLTVGEQSYSLFVRHGYGSSQTVDYHLRKLVYQVGVDADIVAVGHMHRLHHQVYDRQTRSGMRTVHGLRSGGFLRSPEYAETRLMQPAQIGCPIVRLYPNKHKIRVDIDTRVP